VIAATPFAWRDGARRGASATGKKQAELRPRRARRVPRGPRQAKCWAGRDAGRVRPWRRQAAIGARGAPLPSSPRRRGSSYGRVTSSARRRAWRYGW